MTNGQEFDLMGEIDIVLWINWKILSNIFVIGYSKM